MKVYVITQGSYSDYHIVGVKLTREEAERVVVHANDEDYYDYAEIEEYDTDDIKIDTNEEMKDKYWKEYDYHTLEAHDYKGRRTAYKDENEISQDRTIMGYKKIQVTATFPHGTPKEKVEKVMRDRAAKFKAEREGL